MLPCSTINNLPSPQLDENLYVTELTTFTETNLTYVGISRESRQIVAAGSLRQVDGDFALKSRLAFGLLCAMPTINGRIVRQINRNIP